MSVKKFISFNKIPFIMPIIFVMVTILSGLTGEKSYAGDTAQPPVNMIKLLDYAIQSRKSLNINNLQLFSPMNGKTVKVLADSYNIPGLNIYIPVRADYPETTTETITFVACNESDICFNNEQWIGNVFSDTVLIPGQSNINLHPYITGSVFSQEISVYGLINAQKVQTQPIVVFSYEDTNNSSETIQVRLEEVSSSMDTDSNGLPDDFGNALSVGELWVANQWVHNALRNVFVLNLDVPGDTTKVLPLSTVEVEAPTFGKLKGLGLIPQQANSAYLVVNVSTELSAQVDTITPHSKATDLSSWITDATNKAPGTVNQDIGFIGIYLIYFDEQGQNHVLSLPETSAIRMSIQNISKPSWVEVKAFSFPATLMDTYLTNDVEKENKWTEIPSTMDMQKINLNVQEGGIISLYNLGLEITSITPNTIPKGIRVPMVLQGIIPVSTAKNIVQASELYEVRIGGLIGEFRNGSPGNPGIAISAYNGSSENQMFITSPALDTAGPANLEIIDKTVRGLSFVFTDAITVLDVFHITAEIERGPNAQSQDAEITINPVKNPLLSEDGMFLDGDTVTISINNIDDGDQFDGWYSEDGRLFSRLQELIIRVKENLDLKARILRRQYTLNITITPSDTGTVIRNPSGETFAPGTDVELTAEPMPGFQFKNWLLPKDKTSTDNPLTITMDKDYSVTAVFETGPPEISSVARLANSNFEKDDAGKERLVVWAFGGVVWRINGYNLEEDTPLQLVDAKTGKNIGSTFNGIEFADDGSYLDFIIPPYPLYADTMPAYVDVDLKTGTSIVPAFRYYHYSKDNFNIYTTAFITDLSKAEKISIFIDGTSQGSIQFPPTETTRSRIYGLIRVVRILNNPTPSAVASLLGNTLIHGGVYGLPIENTYEVAYYLYQEDTLTETPEIGTAVYSPATDKEKKSLFRKTVFPYELDGTTKDVPTIKITLPTNGLNYNMFRGGITVFGQSSEYNYIDNQVIPGIWTAYQSQIVASDIDPIMTENSTGSTEKITLRAYSLNGFGIRKQALLPFEVASLIRVATDKGVAIVKTAGDEEVGIFAPKGGLAYVDRIELLNQEQGIDEIVRPKTPSGQTEGLLTFETPKVTKAGVVDILIYLRSQPTVPVVILDNALMYYKKPMILDSWVLIPVGLLLTTLGFVAGGSSGGGGPCFIATAVYGTPMAEEIDILRQFRDQYLLTNAIGTAFVDLYYNMSPPLANWIVHHPLCAFLIRCFLTPIVWLTKLAVFYPGFFHLLFILSGLSIILHYRRKKRET